MPPSRRPRQNGAQGTELEEAKQNVQKIDRLASQRAQQDLHLVDRPHAELMENLSLLTTELSLNYVNRPAEPRIGHRASPSSKSTFRPRPPQTARPKRLPNRRSTKKSGACW